MSYSKEDEYINYNGKIPVSSNSATLSKILLTSNEVKEKLNRGEDPLELSILKWERIKDAFDFISNQVFKFAYYGDIYELVGSDTCALCIVAINEYEKEHGCQRFEADKCTKCELSKIEECPNIDSLYSNITYLLGYWPPEWKKIQPKIKLNDFNENQIHQKLGELIDQMIERLKSL